MSVLMFIPVQAWVRVALFGVKGGGRVAAAATAQNKADALPFTQRLFVSADTVLPVPSHL